MTKKEKPYQKEALKLAKELYKHDWDPWDDGLESAHCPKSILHYVEEGDNYCATCGSRVDPNPAVETLRSCLEKALKK